VSDFGIWAMIGFWVSAIGGIAMAVTWANAKNKNPASRKLLEKSLKNRLEAGELSQSEYDRKVSDLTGD